MFKFRDQVNHESGGVQRAQFKIYFLVSQTGK